MERRKPNRESIRTDETLKPIRDSNERQRRIGSISSPLQKADFDSIPASTRSKVEDGSVSAFKSNGYAVSRDLNVTLVPIASCKPLDHQTRKHPPGQVRKLAASLGRFGFVIPILIDGKNRVVAGWGLVLAARQLGLSEVPAIIVTDLSEAELRALRLALNRIAEDSAWDHEALALEFSDILDLAPQLDLQVSGFEMGEIDVILDGGGLDEEDELPLVDAALAPVSRLGDLWILGEHRLFCGDALRAESYARALGTEQADMVFADPPFNVPIAGHASGLGTVKHGNFVMASGELSSPEFVAFLKTSLGHAARYSINGAIHFVCMDWRHLEEMIAGGKEMYSELKNLCIWNKSNAGMGSLYRSKHELIFVFKVGKRAHINNVALGRHGRHRTNVWDYVSQNALNATSKSKLALHPTAKPVALVADAIRDCSNRGGIILDPFGGAGTTLIAAERTGRRARLIEIDPHFVDITIERWQRLTGGIARHADSAQPFVRSPGRRETISSARCGQEVRISDGKGQRKKFGRRRRRLLKGITWSRGTEDGVPAPKNRQRKARFQSATAARLYIAASRRGSLAIREESHREY
jgi:16S rRNA G966 N2-methylase RsmD